MKVKLILDINKTQYAQLNSIVTGRVGDKGNVVDVYIIDSGAPYPLTGLSIFYECLKPDNTFVRDDKGIKIIDAAKGHFEYTFPVEAFGYPGKAKQSFFSIEKDKTVRATTQDFVLVTLSDAQTGNIPSETYISELEEIMNDAKDIVDRASGSPKGVFATLADLKATFPKGDYGIYIVSADGHWYYWNNYTWTVGGAYQSTGIADNSIKTNHYAETSITENKMDISDFIFKRYVVDGYFNSTASGALNFPSFILDLGSDRVVSTVKLKVEFIYLSSEKPTKIPIRLFANNSSSRTDLTGYGSPYFYPIPVPEVNKKYYLEIEFPMTDAEGDKISSFRYLKGYVGFDGKAGWANKVSHARFTKSVLEVDGKEYDVIKTVEDFGTGPSTIININDNQRRFAFKDELDKETKPFEGQIFNSLGDSITYGYDPNNGGAQMLHPWPKKVGEKLGFSTVRNYGISGTTIATKTSDPNWNTARKPMVLRYQDMVDADVISCLGGINDFWLGVPLGTFDSRDTDTFYGALHTLYKGLAEKYPTKKLFVMTCLYYKGTNPNGVALDQWIEAQRQVATYYSIPLFDLYKYSGLSWRIEVQKPLIPDGLHPSQSGADIIAGKIANFIKTL
ncbi:SGNH/GDSL hydrolase family protein [Bacillus wiedmannii]|uniref:SGNH/GDSL hydrolase family protein n=1 Tax=Bacillus wiedmannii TaxID=1890302 RepID=UPI0021D3AF8A|nr:SGNH/GDSL hydrolase family protein [Bacillus wiedmannii]MCU5094990.1 GDSL-type esterase/lipase family protein [Bacillus wiedmannii]